MALEFDPKTGEMTGELTRMMPDELAELEARVKADPAGVLDLPRDTGYARSLRKQQAEHGVGWGLRQAWERLYGPAVV